VLFIAPIVAAIALSAWLTLREDNPPAPAPTTLTIPPRVVHDRPGTTRRGARAKLTEPEAILTLRRHLVATQNLPSHCIAILSNGYRNGAYTLTAVDGCKNAPLGRWKVDGRTGEVGRGS